MVPKRCLNLYSYIIGTKKYEGKNVFKPGKSPMLTFDMPYKIEDSKAKITDIYVIAGGPCSGKTSILKALNEKGYETVPETAEEMIKARTSLEMDGTLEFLLLQAYSLRERTWA